MDPIFGGSLGVIENGAMVCRDTIEWVGPETQLPMPGPECSVLDGQGGVLMPGLVDSHTHLLYGGSREGEFVQRTCGMSYQQIHATGGGIVATVNETRGASREDLLKIGLARLDSFLAQGITTVEVKSGYGLNITDEIKMLEVMQELDRLHFVDVIPTFMAAHALPPEYAGRSSEYVSLIIDEMLPEIAKRRLARFCDVFCDELGFSAKESEAILQAAKSYGFELKIHAEQFSLSGGTSIAVDLAACSVDHLDHISPELERRLAASKVVAVLTPGVNFFLGLDHWPPARRLIDAGVDVALATDFSPGACMTENLALVMTIACVRMGMTPDEAIEAITINGARAVGKQASIGSLTPGKRADAVVWAVPSYEHLAYHFGVDHVQSVVKDGCIALSERRSGCLPN